MWMNIVWIVSWDHVSKDFKFNSEFKKNILKFIVNKNKKKMLLENPESKLKSFMIWQHWLY